MMQEAATQNCERKEKVEKYRKEIEEEDSKLNADRPKEAAFIK